MFHVKHPRSQDTRQPDTRRPDTRPLRLRKEPAHRQRASHQHRCPKLVAMPPGTRGGLSGEAILLETPPRVPFAVGIPLALVQKTHQQQHAVTGERRQSGAVKGLKLMVERQAGRLFEEDRQKRPGKNAHKRGRASHHRLQYAGHAGHNHCSAGRNTLWRPSLRRKKLQSGGGRCLIREGATRLALGLLVLGPWTFDQLTQKESSHGRSSP